MTETAVASVPRHTLLYARLIRVGLVLIYLIALSVSGLVVFQRVREQVASSDLLPDFTLNNPETGDSPNIERVEGEAMPIWTGTDRVNVLLLGIDQRMQEEDDYWRTDTMILATLDPVTMQAGLLSIPRDLWVPIPGYTENRINTAHALGEAYDHPGGGPALAVETVEYNLGVEIDYYVLVNFQAFIDMVDLIGGIDIDVPESFDDTCYPTPDYGCEQLHVDAGPQHFYGDMALKYARVRHTAGGDFDRARRQQQVIDAILERVTDQKLLPELAGRAAEIWAIVDESVRIDPNLKLDEIIALANLATKVTPEDRRSFVIDETCTLFAETPDLQQILIPLRDKIREVRDDFLGLKPPSDGIQTVSEEAATVAVLNGTTTPGLAYAAMERLVANHVEVLSYENADRADYDTSLVILNRDKPRTAEQILAVLDLPQSAVVHGANPTAQYDVVVILGADYVAEGAEDAVPSTEDAGE